MEKIIDLADLLRHEVMDFYSAEEQIIEALPKMVAKANSSELKKALSNHLEVTKQQKDRLDKVQQLLKSNENSEDGNDGMGELKGERRTGFFARLFGGSSSGSGGEKCKGTEGLIKEGEKMMGEDMTPEAMDASIIASAQKIEHYEICGYGTARAFARELNLGEVANLLEQTLNEEYAADDQLTSLAVGKLNIKAEMAEDSGSNKRNGSSASTKLSRSQSDGARKASKGGSKTSKGSRGSKGSKSSKSASKAQPSKASAKAATKSSKNSKGSKSSKGASKSQSPKGSSKAGSKSAKVSKSSKEVSKVSKSSKSLKGSGAKGGNKSKGSSKSPARAKGGRRR